MFDILKGLIPAHSEPRTLTAPEELEIGDIITFQFMAQPEISGKRFQVIAIVTYDFEQTQYPRFALQGEQDTIIFISPHVKDGMHYISISKKISRGDVDKIFGLDPFAEVFEEGSVTLTANLYEPQQSWLAASYYKAIDCRTGYRHIGDYRNEPLPEFEEDSQGLDYYLLCDNTEKFAVEIDVCDDDESDVYLTIYQPYTVIAEMWPAASSQ